MTREKISINVINCKLSMIDYRNKPKIFYYTSDHDFWGGTQQYQEFQNKDKKHLVTLPKIFALVGKFYRNIPKIKYLNSNDNTNNNCNTEKTGVLCMAKDAFTILFKTIWKF